MSKRIPVLIIAYHFPPAGGVKIQRMVKLVKYLCEFGYEPIVLAPKGEHHHSVDMESLAEVTKYAEVRRAMTLDITRPLLALRNIIRTRRKTTPPGREEATARPNTLARRLLRFFAFPDVAILWLIPAVIKGLMIIRSRKMNLVLSSSPPFTTHLIGMILSRFSRIPFIVDLRDLWIDNPFVQPSTKLHYRLGRLCERQVFDHCKHIVCATDVLRQKLIDSYGGQVGEKCSVIYNGYDPDDFTQPLREQAPSFNVVHVGSIILASGRSHEPLTNGVMSAMRKDSRFREDLRLTYLGSMDGENMKSLTRCMDSPDSHKRISYLGPVPHTVAIEQIRRADLLVFLGGSEIDSDHNRISSVTETDSVAAKLFEYLPTGKPILLIAGNCPTVDLALECGVGFRYDSPDPGKVADLLLELYQRFYLKREPLTPDWNRIEQFSRRTQARQFVQIFRNV